MALEIRNAVAWSKDWFDGKPPIRIDPERRTVDVMDVFTVVCTTPSAAGVMQTKWFGLKNVDYARDTIGMYQSDSKFIQWNTQRGKRRVIALSLMIKLVAKIQHPPSAPELRETTKRMQEELANALSELTDGAMVLTRRGTDMEEEVEVDDTVHACNLSNFRVNPFNKGGSAIRQQVETAKECLELGKLHVAAQTTMETYKRNRDVLDAEAESKKQNIAFEQKLFRLQSKCTWATEQNKIQLAAHFEQLIKDL
jgi:hypothetical protein